MLLSQQRIDHRVSSYYHGFMSFIWSHGSKKSPFRLLHNEKMGNAILLFECKMHWVKQLKLFSRPERSQGLLHSQPRDSLINKLIQSVSLSLRQIYGAVTPTQLEITLPVKKYMNVIKNFPNPEGHQNPISGSKVTAILLLRLLNLWLIFFYHLGPLWTIEDHLRPNWTLLDHFYPFRPVWTP